MKGKIKLLSLLLALAMVASLFAACNNGGETSGTGDGTGDEPVEIVWWHWGNAPNNDSAVVEALNEKSAEDIGVTVKFVWATDSADKLNTALSTGQKDDIAFVCSWFASYDTSAQKGYLAPLTDMLKEDQFQELYNSMPEFFWESATVNGEIYAVPTTKDSAAQNFWICNKEYVFDKVGAEEEFNKAGAGLSTVTPLLRKIKEYVDNGGETYPHDLTAPLNFNKSGLNGFEAARWDSILGDIHIGDKLGDDEVKIVSTWEDPDTIADYKEMAMWRKEGLVNQDAQQIESELQYIVVSKAQGWEGAEAVWGNQKDYTVAIKAQHEPIASRATVNGSLNGIFANSEKKEAALKYLQYINTNAEYRNMLAYGIQGENWELTEDGTVKTLNDDWAPGSFSQASTWILTPTTPSPVDMYEDVKEMSMNATPTDLIGFTFVTEDYTNEIAACTAVFQQYAAALACGAYEDVDATLAQAMSELEAAGYRKIIEGCQAQVDEYLASK